MAYGTVNGVKWNMSKNSYQNLIDYDVLEQDQIDNARLKADAMINASLASTVYFTDLPLTIATVSQMALDLINSISDDLTTWFILQPVYIKKDPNKSSWVDMFYDRAMNGDPLDESKANRPGAMGIGLNFIRQQPHILQGTNFFDEIATNKTNHSEDHLHDTKRALREFNEITGS